MKSGQLQPPQSELLSPDYTGIGRLVGVLFFTHTILVRVFVRRDVIQNIIQMFPLYSRRGRKPFGGTEQREVCDGS